MSNKTSINSMTDLTIQKRIYNAGQQPFLSVLICTIPHRERKLNHLLYSIFSQFITDIPDQTLEVITALDDKTMPIGTKRNWLLDESSGRYVVFIDDDDQIADDYLKTIHQATELNPKAIGIWIKCEGTPKNLERSSAKYREWSDDGDFYKRSIYHKTPVLREIAIKAKFPDLRFGEDAEYSKRLLKYISPDDSFDIGRPPLYIYKYTPGNREEKYGFHKDQDNVLIS